MHASAAVYGQYHVVAAVGAHEVGDFIRPRRNRCINAGTGKEVCGVVTGPGFVYGF